MKRSGEFTLLDFVLAGALFLFLFWLSSRPPEVEGSCLRCQVTPMPGGNPAAVITIEPTAYIDQFGELVTATPVPPQAPVYSAPYPGRVIYPTPTPMSYPIDSYPGERPPVFAPVNPYPGQPYPGGD